MRGMIGICGSVMFLLVVSSCATVRVSVDYDPAYDFSRARSYAWLEDDASPSRDIRVNNDRIIERVRRAVEEGLAAKGYIQTDTSSADFWVRWLGKIERIRESGSGGHYVSPHGYGGWGHDSLMGWTRAVARDDEEGNLFVDILDPVQHRLIWRGTGTDRLMSNGGPETVTRGIYNTITAILASFPPQW